jgi:tRNA isopentenyl-2-thiomethyl-A-37 hydroxylase MiaE
LAKLFAPDAQVDTRLQELAKDEAEIIAQGEPEPRVHS